MIQSYFEKTIFITLILVSIQSTNKINEFTVDRLDLSEKYYCTGSRIEFNIVGSFNGSTGLFDKIYFNVTSNGNKYEAECLPSSLNRKLLCHIKLRYPVINSDIYLPTTPPEDEKYTFKNWENVFGSRGGEIQKLKNLTCKVNGYTSFTPTSITLGECIKNSDKRRIIINGEWDDNKEGLSYNMDMSISFDNENGELIECQYNKTNIGFECDFKVEGIIKIKEQYFEEKTLLGYKIYKINKYESDKTASKCINNNSNGNNKDDDNDGDDFYDFNEDDIKEALSANSLKLLNKILILLSLLLF